RVTARVGAISESQCAAATGAREITDGRGKATRSLRIAAQRRCGDRSRVGPGTECRGERGDGRGFVANGRAVFAYRVGVIADGDGSPAGIGLIANHRGVLAGTCRMRAISDDDAVLRGSLRVVSDRDSLRRRTL